jgi:predicted Zn-dependent peptidase
VCAIYKNTCHFEDEKTFGVSHLLEHMICNAVDSKLEEYMSLAITKNAYTSKDHVCFYISGINEILKTKAKEFFDLTTNYVPTEEDFEKEIGIVCQEYQDSFATPRFNAYFNFSSQQLGYVYPIGIRPALETISFEDTLKFYNDYFKLNEIIIINKDGDNYGIEDKTEKEITPVVYNGYKYFEECNINEMSQNMFMALKNLIPFEDNNFYIPFIAKILSEGLSSPLYKVLREEKSLIYFLDVSAVYYKMLGNGFIINVASSTEKAGQIKESIFEVLNSPDKYFTKDYFEKIKENTRIRTIIREQDKANFNYIDIEYLTDKRVAFSKHLNEINYDELRSYYDTYIHPKKVTYEFLTHSEINSRSAG